MVLVTSAPILSAADDTKALKSLVTLLPPAYVDARPRSYMF
jgi:hypothetical protein